MNRYPGEHAAFCELLSIVADEMKLEDRWAIVEWVRREMHAASPDEIDALVDRASAEISQRSPEGQRRTVLARLNGLRERVREIAWEQAYVRGATPEDLVDAMHEMIRAVDPALSTHLSGVGTLAARIAKYLGLDGNRVHDVAIAGRLLDAGKIGSSGDDHAVAGERMVRAIPGLQRYAGWIRSHHERLDGSGYPDALRSPDIPMEVRILSVADVFTTLACAAPYAPHVIASAVEHLTTNAGTLYDSHAVGTLERIVGARRISVAASTAA